MKIILKTKNIDTIEQIEAYVDKKVKGILKFLKPFEGHALPAKSGKELFDIFVEVKKETNHHKKGDIFTAGVTLSLPGKNVFVRAHGDDVLKVIVKMKDELETEIRKYKAKVIDMPRRKFRKLDSKNRQ